MVDDTNADTPGRRGRGQPKKYTLDFVLNEAKAFLRFVQDSDGRDTDKSGQPKSSLLALFVADFIVTRDYHPNRWGEWKKEYADDDEFSGLVKKGEMILEGRLTRMGLLKPGAATMSIFLLANHYGYSRADRPNETQSGYTPGDLERLDKEAFRATYSGTESSGSDESGEK